MHQTKVYKDVQIEKQKITMNTATLDPIVSEFLTEKDATSYDRWFCDKVQEAIDSKRPKVSHDDVMAKMDALVAKLKQKKAA